METSRDDGCRPQARPEGQGVRQRQLRRGASGDHGAIALANGGHQVSYGDDVYTEALREVFRRHFGEQAEAFPVFNGTAANVVSLRSMCAPWEAVICPESAHINSDEAAPPR